MIHKPVLLGEAIENLNLARGMTVVDGTLGAGGHSSEILKKILPGGKLISIDWDERAIENFKKKIFEGIYIKGYGKVTGVPAPVTNNANGENISPSAFVPLFLGDKIVGYWRGANENYANLDKIVRDLKINEVNAIFVDLGFSSDQIEDEKRGFSFLKNGLLDMRYSPGAQKLTAAEVVNKYPEEKLAEIFKNFGEEKFARKIAREIGARRKIKEIGETGELVEIILKAVRPRGQKGMRTGRQGIHPATKAFQALRIEVNKELENLKIFLRKAANLLKPGGRLAVISFHSLEDRIVKDFFQKESRDCVCPPKFPKCVCNHKARLKIVTKKPIKPGEKEMEENPRARSARLRVAQKI